jgi:hypothetical protein
MSTMKKTPSTSVHFRANVEDMAILKRLGSKLGINQTAVVRQALRCLDKKEGGK